jgi:hypothetical protein
MDALAQLTGQHRHIEDLLARARTDRTAIIELADAITLHLAVEQDRLYPRLAISRSVLAELHAEHTEIRRVLGELCWLDGDGDAEDRAPALAKLAELVFGHAAWQDRELFEMLAETLPTGVLADLEATVRAAFATDDVLAA